MSSSPLSSTLSTPPKTKIDELPSPHGVKGPQADQLRPQPQQSATNQPPAQRNQQRTKKVHQQKVVGTTILPVTRVTRAAKQDKDIKIVSKEAVFLISIATEFFVKKLTDSAFERSKRERRVFVKYNDVASAVKRNPEYDWLEEVIPASLPLGTILRDPTIPTSSTAITNSLPTDTLMKLNDQSSAQQSKVSLAVNSHTDSLDTDSHPNPELHPIDDDGMDVDDQDELDEDL
ncbi:hypothetical protein PtA15_12A457 [Puccinia triticina]|uniref:Transcription factor CBF/NF-Y/archaeal histone domain-containing protein n=1 Tax=Puccinia triticina TaxID=208348 RepID=A0ABY7CZY6_9BASI|nr:uncharacterized protein PtA15_12A457 [Puccinia triticina]WAQ90468.1 hypothetical protein PtA15_12A457 [Puccinia triticina]